MKNCNILTYLVLSALLLVAQTSGFAQAQVTKADATVEKVVLFMFPDKDLRTSLSNVKGSESISSIRPRSFSEADFIVYIVDKWTSVASVQGSDVLGYAADQIAELPSSTLMHLAEFEKVGGGQVTFVFINSGSVPTFVDWNCMAEFMVWIVFADSGSEPFSFENCKTGS